jgi:hypothetical protein
MQKGYYDRGEYQRRTQKGIGRNGKIPNVFGTKTQRWNTAGAVRAIDMVRFFDIYFKMSFLVKSLTVQKKPFFLILGRFILKINMANVRMCGLLMCELRARGTRYQPADRAAFAH